VKEAMLWERAGEGKVRCSLCAHRCLIKPGRRGKCSVRENVGGSLVSLVYGRLIAANIDPIEKKPLFHFLPGSRSFSIATVGCNFRCAHCQNFDISQYPRESPGADVPGRDFSPADVVEAAAAAGCESISYTYTEPTVFLEFAYDTARAAHERGIRNVFVSNGYMTPESARLIAPYLDANNIDLKGDDEFYKEICGARVRPVRETIRLMKELGVWVEVTTLVIPGHNDSERTLGEIVEFIASVDPSIPWHVSRFHPTYKMLDRPPTPVETLRKALEIGVRGGLRYVYTGNVPGEESENTHCPRCGELLIGRVGFSLTANRLAAGACNKCSEVQAGVWQ
jgi:pyruvate formate lyase activating enzyme